MNNQVKTFFKGAVEYLQGGEMSSMADNDDSLKKILDDQLVMRKYTEKMNEGQLQDFINQGLLP